MKKLTSTVKFWLPLAVVITLLSGMAYGVGQQVLRQSANDPQVQVAEDAAAVFAGSDAPLAIDYASQTDLSTSLQTFQMSFDDTGKLQNAGVILDGTTPLPPAGVFDYARKNTEHRFTWQPKTGVRIAVVLRHYSGKSSGFVLAGRSLREVEIREQRLMQMVAAGWAVSMFVVLGLAAIL